MVSALLAFGLLSRALLYEPICADGWSLRSPIAECARLTAQVYVAEAAVLIAGAAFVFFGARALWRRLGPTR